MAATAIITKGASRRRWLARWAKLLFPVAGCSLCCFAAPACSTANKCPVECDLVNKSSQPIEGLALTCEGDQKSAETLAPGGTAKVRLCPARDTSVILSFRLGAGPAQRCDLDVYVQKGRRQQISINISDGPRVQRVIDGQDGSTASPEVRAVP